MRFRSLTTALTALVLVSGTAKAQVTYTFTTPDFFGGLSLTWTVERPGPVAAAGAFATTSCSVTAAMPGPTQSYGCPPEQDFNPNGFGTGFSYLSASFIEFDGLDPVGGGTGFFFVEAGALLADGVYAATRDGLAGDGGNFYASAGDATLVVRGITSSVPEPGTLALLSLGLGGLAVVTRRRGATV